MFHSIRWKITLTYFALFLLTILLLSGVLSTVLKNYFMNNVTEQLTKKATMAEHFLAANYPFDSNNVDNLIKEIGTSIEARITIIDTNGTVISDSEENPLLMDNHGNRPEFATALRGEIGHAIRTSKTVQWPLSYVAIPLTVNGEIQGAVRLSIPLTAIEQTLGMINKLILYTFLTATVVFIALSLRLSLLITKPLEDLTASTTRIALGDLNHRIYTVEKGEIGQLQQSINFMAEKQQEKIEEIEDKKSRLETVLTNMTSGIIVINHKGRVNLINQATENLLNVKTDQIMGKHCMSLLPNQHLEEDLKEMLIRGKVIVRDISLQWPVERFLQVVYAPIYHGKIIKEGVIVLTDITTIKQLEKMRSQFVANVSHELKTPLTSIKGFAETLQSGMVNDQHTAERFLNIIASETQRLSRLIEDILELSKIEANKNKLPLEAVNLTQVIDITVNQLKNSAAKAGLTITTQISNDYQVLANSDGLKQILLNLLQNAINYTAAGQINLTVMEKPQHVVVSITDKGMGIPQEDLPRIFERFYRVDKARSRDKGGTGLGLSIVKHLVESFGGSIWAESEEGVGSTFFFTLAKIHENH